MIFTFEATQANIDTEITQWGDYRAIYELVLRVDGVNNYTKGTIT